MKHLSSTASILAAMFVLGLSISPAMAQGDLPPEHDPAPKVSNVPEIDAGSGLTALAAVGASLLLARDRRRAAKART